MEISAEARKGRESDKKSLDIIKSPKSTLDNTVSSPSDARSSTRRTTEAGPSQQLTSPIVKSAESATNSEEAYNSEEATNSANQTLKLKKETVLSKPCRVFIKPLKDLIGPAVTTETAMDNSQLRENVVKSPEITELVATEDTVISSTPVISGATKAVKQADGISILVESGLAATSSDLVAMSPSKNPESKTIKSNKAASTSPAPKSRAMRSLTQKSTTSEVSSIPSGSKPLKSTSETPASASSILKKASKETDEKNAFVKKNIDKAAKMISTKMRKDRPSDETFEEGTTKENNSS